VLETTPDLRHAKVYLDSVSDLAKEALEERRAQIQASVNAQTRLKRTPKLAFMVDPAIASARPSMNSCVASVTMTNNGLLLIDKPQGVTSHDVVGHVRRVLNEQRVATPARLIPWPRVS